MPSFIYAQEASPKNQSIPSKKVLAHYSTYHISKITLVGNKQVSKQAVLAKIPFSIGELFDSNKTGLLINALYDLGFFTTIQVAIQPDDSEETVEVIITVQEKQKVSAILFKGNDHLHETEIEKSFNLSTIKALDQQEYAILETKIKNIYAEKNYHNVAVNHTLDTTDPQAPIITFIIDEGSQTIIKHVDFIGNNNIPSKALRALLFTREDWLFSFLDKSGTYNADALEFDKQLIEKQYHDTGFLAASVIDTKIAIDEKTNTAVITFIIDEGDRYILDEISAPGNDIVTEQQLLTHVPLISGHYYSKELVRNSMEALRLFWGEFGYINADVEPSVLPDQETKTVSITFNSTLGEKIYLRRIDITGNRSTHDRVIRRNILLNEGELLTISGMNNSKSLVEQLGYFDPRSGVNWRIHKVDENTADLELLVNEIRTGKVFFQFAYGGNGDIASPTHSMQVSASFANTNFLGTGMQYKASGAYSKQNQNINLSVANPYLFDRPLIGGGNFVIGNNFYEDFQGAVSGTQPKEQFTGISGTLGFKVPELMNVNITADAGFRTIKFNNIMALHGNNDPTAQTLINKRFASGSMVWVSGMVAQSLLNNPYNPSRGYMWSVNLKYAIPQPQRCFSFTKVEANAQWFTPIINEFDLILRLHGTIGFIAHNDNYLIPYDELYHIGGPATVRGFLFGQISPTYYNDSIGGKKAFFGGAELSLPFKADFSIRGILFYDGGAGWDTPNAGLLGPALRNNTFEYRSAVGFGLRLTNPTPIAIDIGFKLDPKKRLGESISEVAFTMSQGY
jgi:outer membrane protein insertion porin family